MISEFSVRRCMYICICVYTEYTARDASGIDYIFWITVSLACVMDAVVVACVFRYLPLSVLYTLLLLLVLFCFFFLFALEWLLCIYIFRCFNPENWHHARGKRWYTFYYRAREINSFFFFTKIWTRASFRVYIQVGMKFNNLSSLYNTDALVMYIDDGIYDLLERVVVDKFKSSHCPQYVWNF